MEFVEVATVNDLDDGQMVGFEVDDRRILLAKEEGEFFAIGATCTHERSNLDQGALMGHVVYCPLHYSAFDVRSGAVLGPPAECPVPKHEVRIEDGRVLVCTQPCALEAAAPPAATNGAAVEQPSVEQPPVEPAPVEQPAREEAGVSAEAAAVVASDGADPSLAAPETIGAVRELAGQVARLEQSMREFRSELAERVDRLEQSVKQLGNQLAAETPFPGSPPRAGVGGDPWSHQSPAFMARIPTSARYLPLAVAIPAGIVALLVLTAAVLFRDGPAVPGGDILFEHFIGHGWLDVFTLSLVAVVVLLAATGVRKFWRGLQATVPPAIPRQPLGGALRGTAEEVLRHDGFKDWTVTDMHRKSHLAIFYGFLGLLAATTGAALYTEIFPLLGIEWQGNELSLPIWDPVKIVGNVGGIALLAGLAQTLSMWRRRARADQPTYSDWFFPGLLGLTALSGFATEILRFAGVRLAYPAYAVHLVFVFALFVYFPFSKFAHAMYYPAGFTFARSIGGRKKAAPKPAPAASRRDPDTAPV